MLCNLSFSILRGALEHTVDHPRQHRDEPDIAPGHTVLFARADGAEKRFWEIFTANIRNPNTRMAYLAAYRFADWCEAKGLALDRGRAVACGRTMSVAQWTNGLGSWSPSAILVYHSTSPCGASMTYRTEGLSRRVGLLDCLRLSALPAEIHLGLSSMLG